MINELTNKNCDMEEKKNGEHRRQYGRWPGHGVYDAKKQREWEEWCDRRRLPDWCYDDETIGEHSLAFKLLVGVVIGLLVGVPILWSPKLLGLLGAIGILYWLFRLFGLLWLPLFGVSAHRWWRAWQFGRRHS